MALKNGDSLKPMSALRLLPFFVLLLACLSPSVFSDPTPVDWADWRFEARSPLAFNPHALSLERVGGKVELSWSGASEGPFVDPDQYNIFRAPSTAPSSEIQVGTVRGKDSGPAPNYFEDDPGPGSWCYRVQAYREGGLFPSEESVPACLAAEATSTPTATAAPSDSSSNFASSALVSSKKNPTNTPTLTPTVSIQPYWPNGPNGGGLEQFAAQGSGATICGADTAKKLDLMVNCGEQGTQDRRWNFLIVNNGSSPLTLQSAGLALRVWFYESGLRCVAIVGNNADVFNSSGTRLGNSQIQDNVYTHASSLPEFDESSAHKSNQTAAVTLVYQGGVSVIPAGGWVQGFSIIGTSGDSCGTATNWDNFNDDYSGLPNGQSSCNGTQSGPFYDDHHFALYSNGTLVQEFGSNGSTDGESGVPPGGGTCTPTLTPTFTRTNTPTRTATPTKTGTFTATRTPTPVPNTDTFTPTATKTSTDTPSPSKTFTWTFTPSLTFTPTFTHSWTPSPTPTFTATPTWTDSFTPSSTDTFTWTPTDTFTFTWTSTDTYTPTPSPTETWTDTATPTDTPSSTFTFTNTDTWTTTDTPTATWTSTATDTSTSTPTDSPTNTATDSFTPSSTDTFTWTPSSTFTAVNTAIPTRTSTPTGTPIQSLCPFVIQDEAMDGPSAVALDSSGEIYETDSFGGQVQVFDASGGFLRSWDGSASGLGPLSVPSGLAVDSGNNEVYVADTGNDRIMVFDLNGNFIMAWGTPGSGNGELAGPSQVAAPGNGFVYVADTYNNRIQVFQENGTYVSQVGAPGSADGQLNGPQGVVVDASGNIYVSDSGNNRVEVFNSSGLYQRQWGSAGPSVGQFEFPGQLSIGTEGLIYVTDSENQRIEVFDASGLFVTQYGNTLQGGPFLDPMGIFTLDSSHIYVADPGVNEILKLEPCSQVPTPSDTPTLTPTPTFTPTLPPVVSPTPLGCPGQVFQDPAMDGPDAVAVDGSGNFYEAEAFAGQVQVFDPAGNLLSAWDGSSSGTPFAVPGGVAVDTAHGLVYVSDSGNDRIVVFDLSGNYQFQWGGTGSGNGQFDNPEQVAVPGDGFVYVADTDNNRIQKFTPNGAFVLQFGSPGAGNGQFDRPLGVGVDPSGNIYVSDSGNSRVEVFDPSGDYLSQWGSFGSAPGQFADLHQLSLGPAPSGSGQAVYAADATNQRIQVFDLSGALLGQMDGFGASNPLGLPLGVYAADSTHVYAADLSANEVVLLGPCGSIPTATPTFTPTPTPTFQSISLCPYAFLQNDSMFGPSGLGTDSNGNLYEVEAYSGQVQVFDPNGNFLNSWDGSSSGTAFAGSEGLVVGPAPSGSGQAVYISDTGNNRIVVFDLNGNYLNSWGSGGVGNGQFNAPAQAALLNGYLYVADSGNNRIQKFTTGGTYVSQFGAFGTGDGQLDNPQGLVLDGSGNIYVSDTGNNRVETFDKTGLYQSQWGTLGGGPGQFDYPNQLTLGPDGLVYVADSVNQRVQVFNASGLFVEQFDGTGPLSTGFAEPAGVLVLDPQHVYVSDTGVDQVDLLEPCSSVPTATGTSTATQTPLLSPTPLICTSAAITDDSMAGPNDVDVDEAGNVYEVEYDSGQVQVFDPSGTRLRAWDGSSSGTAFQNPSGIVADSASNRVYVTDTGANRVVIFDLEGNYIAQWTGSGDFPVNEPNFLSLAPDGFVYVANSGSNQVLKFSADGTVVAAFGDPSGAGALNQPLGVAVDGQGMVYVTDNSGNGRVAVFRPNGTYAAQWAIPDASQGHFLADISEGPDGLFYVVDELDEVVDVFNASGILQSQTNGMLAGSGAFSDIWGLSMREPGRLFLADYGANQVVELSGCSFQTPTPVVTPTLTQTATWTPTPFSCASFAIADSSMDGPEAVGLDADGNVYEGEAYSGLVQVFSPNGGFLRSWDGSSSGTAFSSIFGLAVDSSAGQVYVGDSGNNRIVEFNLDGSYVRQWTDADGSGGPFGFTAQVAAPGDGHVYVADFGNNRVEKFTTDGNYVSQFGQASGPGQLAGPLGVALDPSGNVYVSNINGPNVVEFDSNGNWVRTWGQSGSGGGGNFEGPAQLSVAGGLVYVTDIGNATVQVFDTQGRFVSQFDGSGQNSPAFNDPFGIFVLDSGHIYVADDGLNEVVAIQACGSTPVPTMTPTPPIGEPACLQHAYSLGPVPTADCGGGYGYGGSGDYGGGGGCSGPTLGFQQPSGVALAPNGDIYVADQDARDVQVFAPNGGFLFRFGQDRLQSARGVAVSPDGAKVFVSDPDNGVILVFDAGGIYQSSFNGDPDLGNFQPWGLSMGPDGNLYVADLWNMQVDVFSQSGVYQSEVGAAALSVPYAVALDAAGNVYVADHGDDTLSVFGPDGTPLASWGGGGSGQGNFQGILDVKLDPSGLVWVSESGGNPSRIQVFQQDGAFVSSFSGSRYGGDDFGEPSMFINPGGDLFVADGTKQEVQKFYSCADIPTPTPAPSPVATPCLRVSGTLVNSSQANSPVGITVDASGNLYINRQNQVLVYGTQGVLQNILYLPASSAYSNAGLAVDSRGRVAVALSNGTILVLNPDGTQSLNFGSGEFDGINAVAASPSGSFYATDNGGNRVNVFNSSGQFQFSFGDLGGLPGQFYKPLGVAVDPSGNVYVTDTTNRVQKFTSTGQYLAQWGGTGNGPTQFDLPQQVAVDAQGLVWVSDSGNNRVVVYDGNGRFLSQFPIDKNIFSFPLAVPSADGGLYVLSTTTASLTLGTYVSCSGSTAMTPTSTITPAPTPCATFALQWGAKNLRPESLAVDTQGRIYELDSNSNQVNSFLPQGIFLKTFTNPIAGAGGIALGPDGRLYVSAPGYVGLFNLQGSAITQWSMSSSSVGRLALDAHGNVYVAEPDQNQVQIFNPVGNPLGTIGVGGNGPGQLTHPFAIALGGDGKIYVGEQGDNQRISVFDRAGGFLRSWGGPGSGPGLFNNISDMRFDANGLLWVSEDADNRIQVFDPYGDFEQSFAAPGTGLGQLNGPRCLAFGPDGALFEGDLGSDRIQKFIHCGQALETPTPTQAATLPPTPCVTPLSSLAVDGPVGVASGANGSLYVAQFFGGTAGSGMSLFNASGVLTSEFGFSASSQAAFSGLAVGPNGLFYFPSANNGTVFETNVFGKLANKFGTLNKPGKIAFDGLGHAYVCDNGNNQIQVFDMNGNHIFNFGALGQLQGQMTSPQAVAAGPDGDIYVGEQGDNQRISVFNNQGVFQRGWGGPGNGQSQFNNISDMAFDPGGLLWVLDSGNNRLQVFDRFGNYLESLGGPGTGLGQFQSAKGIAFSPQGQMEVADTGNNRVQVFVPCGFGVPTPTATPSNAPATYVLRLDVGGSKGYLDQAGEYWVPDRAFPDGVYGYTQGGQAAVTLLGVGGTQDTGLYQSYRSGSTLAYQVKLPPGSYSITLKFADFLSDAPGQNLFDVSSQGQPVFQGVDVFAQAGGAARALDKSFQETVASGQFLTLQLSATAGQAMLSGIEVVGLQPDPTPLVLHIKLMGGGFTLRQ